MLYVPTIPFFHICGIVYLDDLPKISNFEHCLGQQLEGHHRACPRHIDGRPMVRQIDRATRTGQIDGPTGTSARLHTTLKSRIKGASRGVARREGEVTPTSAEGTGTKRVREPELKVNLGCAGNVLILWRLHEDIARLDIEVGELLGMNAPQTERDVVKNVQYFTLGKRLAGLASAIDFLQMINSTHMGQIQGCRLNTEMERVEERRVKQSTPRTGTVTHILKIAAIAVLVLNDHPVVLVPRRKVSHDVRVGRDDCVGVDLTEQHPVFRQPCNLLLGPFDRVESTINHEPTQCDSAKLARPQFTNLFKLFGVSVKG
jgi:hypothetical protein